LTGGIMACLLGIDIGTTGTKALLIDESGKIIARKLIEYPLAHPMPNWAEQNPLDWWNATVGCIKSIIRDSRVTPGDIKGLGLSGQMHGSVFLDRNNNVLRPAILWCDQRTQGECDEITRKIGGAKLLQLTLNPALTGFTAPKILWLRKNEPEVYDKVSKILLPKDYIRFMLTGEFATEVSDASGTLLFDVRNRCWSKEVLEYLDIDKGLLPQSYESYQVTGKTTKKVEELTRLPCGTPVVGGGGDQAAGAVGNGVVRSGIVSATIGTSGVVFATCDSPSGDPQGRAHTFCHAVPGKWHIMGVMLQAGGSFRWLRDVLGDSETKEAASRGIDPYEILTEKASEAPCGSEGLIFLPYLMGERTPYPDPNAKGVFFGLSLRHKKPHLIRAVMEGVAFGMKDSLSIIRQLGVMSEEIRASGGGARSKLWRQIQADVYNVPVCTINIDEGPAFGVALLAGVGTGVYGSVEEACDLTIRVVDRVIPDKANIALYEKIYEVYRSLYPALKDKFALVSEITNV
jgi:xylulokinase